MRRRWTTREEDVAFLTERMKDLSRDWKIGDQTVSWGTRTPATIVSFDGDRVTLSDGVTMHRSHLRRP